MVGGSVLAGAVVVALAAALVRGLAGGDDGDAGRGDTRHADATRLLALARGALDEDPRRAALSALLAARLEPSLATDLALLDVALDHAGVERTIAAHPDRVTAAARVGDVAISAGADGTLRVWSAANGALLRERRLDRPIVQLAAAPDGSLVASCDEAGHMAVWRIGDPAAAAASELRGIWPGTAPPVLLAFAARETELLAVGPDGRLARWDVASGERLPSRDLRNVAGVAWAGGHPHVVAASVPENRYDPRAELLVATRAGEVARIELETLAGDLLAEPGQLRSRVTSLTGDPYGGGDVVVGTKGGVLGVGEDFSVPSDPFLQRGPAITGVAREDDAVTLATAEGIASTIADDLYRPLSPHGRGATGLAGGANGIVATYADGAIGLLDASSDQLALEPGEVTSVAAFAPGGDLLVTEGWDARQIERLLLVRPGEPGSRNGGEVPHRVVRSFEPPTSWWPQGEDDSAAWYVNDAVDDGRFVVAGGQDPTGTASVLVWDARTGRPLARLPLTSGGIESDVPAIVTSVASLPEHELIAAYSVAQETLVLWSTDDWRQVATVDIGPAGDLVVSPDEETILVNGLSDEQADAAAGFDRSRLIAFDVESRRVRDEVPTRNTHRLALSPDGERIATLEHGGMLRIRAAGDGRELRRPITLDDDLPLALAWRPDGEALAVAGEKGVVLVDPVGGGISTPLPQVDEEARTLTLDWSPDGELLAAGNGTYDDDGAPAIAAPTLWRVGRDLLVQRVCALAGAEATAAEWRVWAGGVAAPASLCPEPDVPASAAAPQPIEEPVVAYRRGNDAYVAGIDGRARLLGKLMSDVWPLPLFVWSPQGTLAWTSGDELIRLDAGAERTRSWPCPCDRAAFDGETLVALNRTGTKLLRFAPGAAHATDVAVAGLPSYEPRLIAVAGGDALVSAYSREPDRATPSELFRVRADGTVDRVAGDLTGVVWQPAVTEPGGSLVAFVAGWSGGACYSPSAVGVIDLANARITLAPEYQEEELTIVRSLSWPRDGELHVHEAPIGCGDDYTVPRGLPLGTLSTLRGDKLEPTGTRAHDVQVGSRATALIEGPLDGRSASPTGTLELKLPDGERVAVADDVEMFAVRP